MDDTAVVELQAPSITPASQGQRFLTMVVDIVAFYLLCMLLGVLLTLVGVGDWLMQVNDSLFGMFLMLLYFVPQEAITGRTLGKLVAGTRVVHKNGAAPSIGAIVGRTFCRFIPFEPFSFLGQNGKPRGWHDRISNTTVISIKT